MNAQSPERLLLQALVQVMVTGFDGDELDGHEDPRDHRAAFQETVESLVEHSPDRQRLVECALHIFDELYPSEGSTQSMLHCPESYTT